jgi:hypothetical protein
MPKGDKDNIKVRNTVPLLFIQNTFKQESNTNDIN